MPMEQLRNTTRSGSFLQKLSTIKKCLIVHPEGITPKLIALKTGLNVNTVKSILPNMEDVTRPLRGIYKVVDRGDTPLPTSLQDWNFHNLMLSFQLPVHVSYFSHEYKYGLCSFSLVISGKGLATLRVSTDYPLNVSSISVVFGFFEQVLFTRYMYRIVPNQVYVRTIEFNKDYANLRLDGVGCITLDNLMTQFKLYQKRNGLRVEHKTKVKFSVDNMVSMLAANPNSLELEVRLSQQREQLERLSRTTAENTKLMLRLIELQGGD